MFLIIVVLYNKTIDTSATLKGILQCADIINKYNSKLLLCDNSFKSLQKADRALLQTSIRNIEYMHTPQNLSLSGIYNQAIEIGHNHKEYKYLMLLDDDSNIEANYFIKAYKAAAENYCLILPVIINKQKIRSPMRYYPIQSFFFSKLKGGIIPSKNLMAINSGMIISLDFLKKTAFKYDEKLKNYGTDNYFMKFYAKNSQSAYVLDYSFAHSLSFFDDTDINKKLTIFKQHKKVMLYLHSDNVFDYIMALTSNLLSSLKNSLKYKNYQFLK